MSTNDLINSCVDNKLFVTKQKREINNCRIEGYVLTFAERFSHESWFFFLDIIYRLGNEKT